MVKMVKNRSDLAENLKKIGFCKAHRTCFFQLWEGGGRTPLSIAPTLGLLCSCPHSWSLPLSLMGSADEVNMTTYHGLPGGIAGHSRTFQGIPGDVKRASNDRVGGEAWWGSPGGTVLDCEADMKKNTIFSQISLVPKIILPKKVRKVRQK